MINKTRITRSTAVSYTAWVRRAAAHPRVAQVLAAGEMSESYARTICDWTDKLPEDCRPDADAILLGAAGAGMDLPDLAAEIYARSLPDAPDEDKDEAFEDRSVRLETTFEGAGVLAESTPECAAVVGAVLDALSAPAGAEDTRTREQRYHDGLQEAMRRLVAAGLLPERAGQPVKAWVHISLADLLLLDGSSALQEEWTAGVHAQWAAHRAAASAGGAEGGAWLDGEAAAAVACDAAMAPIVTGEVNPAVLEDLIRLCVQLDKLRYPSRRPRRPGQRHRRPRQRPWRPRQRHRCRWRWAGRPRRRHQPGLGSPRASGDRQGGRFDVGSGRAGGVLRRQLGARLGGPSLPLDIGMSESIPASIRNAVILRDKQCQWAGRCNQPASACEVHHVRHKNSSRPAPKLRPAVFLPPPGGDPPVGLDPGPEPRRHHHRLEQGQNQGPARPRAPGPPPGNTPRGRWPRVRPSQVRAPDDARQGNLEPRRHLVLARCRAGLRWQAIM